MTFVRTLFSILIVCCSYSIQAEEVVPDKLIKGFISDELFIYMHSGAGNNYRILGSINSGTEIQLSGVEENEYTQIIDDKNRKVWVESKYVSTKPGLRFIIAELNEKLASIEGRGSELQDQLLQANRSVEELNSEKIKLQREISTLNATLKETTSKLKDQDMNIKKEWFFNGAVVLCIGLILGLIIPRLGSHKKSGMDNWK